MRPLLLGWLFFLLAVPTHGYAQYDDPEAGQRVYSSLLTDTAAILKQIRMANNLAEIDPDSATALVDYALKSSLALKFKDGTARAFYELGVLYVIKNKQQQSIAFMQAAILYLDTGKARSAILSKIYSAIAQRYQSLGNNDSSAAYCYKALDELERGRVKNAEALVNTYSKVVLLWLTLLDDPDNTPGNRYIKNAENYLNKAAILEQKNARMLAKIILSKGLLYQMKKQTDSALLYYHTYLDIAKQGNAGRQTASIISTNVSMGQLFLLKEMPDSSIYYSKRALAEMKKYRPDSLLQTNAIYTWAKGLLLEKKYREAITILLPALQTALYLPVDYQLIGHRILSSAYAGAGDHQRAWQQQNLYIIKDSVNKREKMAASIGRMEAKYQLAERRKELAERKNELAEKELALAAKNSSLKTKNFIIGAFAAMLLLIVTAYFLQQRLKRFKQAKEMEIARLTAAIDAVEKERSRIARELHDGIGGLLGSIGLQLGAAFKMHNIHDESGDFANIQGLLSDAYLELRQTSHNLMPESLKYDGLVLATEQFCKGVSKGNILKINFECSGIIPPMPPDFELAIYRIIQELIHNIIKHSRASEGFVQLVMANNRLSITVEDNGIGMITGDAGHYGMGMKTIQERLKVMNGMLDISTGPGKGTSINIIVEPGIQKTVLPYEYKNNDN